MRRRPHSRHLDRVAKDAFRFLIPRRWNFRRIDPDYGIGGGVEIFDDEGRPTGLRCQVQLTGADAPNPSDALTLLIRKEKVDYYSTLDPPLLMVRYHAPTGHFYSKWALHYHPHQRHGEHRARFARKSKKSKTIGFTWAESDRWDDRSPFRLENDLRLMRQLSEPWFSWPMRFTLDIQADSRSDLSKANVASAIRKQWGDISRYVRLVDDESQAQGSITLSRTMIRVTLGGFHTVTVPLQEPCLSSENLRSMLSNAVVLIAIALTRAGHAKIAARLCHLSFGSDALTL